MRALARPQRVSEVAVGEAGRSIESLRFMTSVRKRSRPPGQPELIKYALGVRPKAYIGGPPTIQRAFGSDPDVLRNIASSQFQLVLTEAELASAPAPETLVMHACGLAMDSYPLLMHRTLYLAFGIFRKAFSIGPAQSAALFERFGAEQAPRIMHVSEVLDQALERYRDGSLPALADAYNKLVEGMFRPFATAVVYAYAFAFRRTPAIDGWPRLADLETQLDAIDSELTSASAFPRAQTITQRRSARERRGERRGRTHTPTGRRNLGTD